MENPDSGIPKAESLQSRVPVQLQLSEEKPQCTSKSWMILLVSQIPPMISVMQRTLGSSLVLLQLRPFAFLTGGLINIDGTAGLFWMSFKHCTKRLLTIPGRTACKALQARPFCFCEPSPRLRPQFFRQAAVGAQAHLTMPAEVLDERSVSLQLPHSIRLGNKQVHRAVCCSW